jgi:hypothetical protein
LKSASNASRTRVLFCWGVVLVMTGLLNFSDRGASG